MFSVKHWVGEKWVYVWVELLEMKERVFRILRVKDRYDNNEGRTALIDKQGNGSVRVQGDSIERKREKMEYAVAPHPGIGSVPKAMEGEQVAAGWPSWLAAVAGEAIRGWLPRRADSFEKLDKIGQGTYSNVYRARDLEQKKIVALKKVRFDNLEPESVRFMAREIHILRRLDHPNVIKLEGLVTSRMSCSLYLVFEYMEHDLAGLASHPGLKLNVTCSNFYVDLITATAVVYFTVTLRFFSTKPLPCDPSSLPKYPPSKEFDAKVRDEEARRQGGAGVKGQRHDLERKGTRESRAIPAPDANAELVLSMQVWSFLVVKLTPLGPLTHRAAWAKAGKNQEDAPKVSMGGDLSTISGLVAARRSMLSDDRRERSASSQADAQKLISRFPGSFKEASESMTQQDQKNNHAHAPQKEEGRASSNKDSSLVGYGSKGHKIHYSGPLLVPSSNMDQMLKDHDRQIQEAVRRSRLDKAKMRRLQAEGNQISNSLFGVSIPQCPSVTMLGNSSSELFTMYFPSSTYNHYMAILAKLISISCSRVLGNLVFLMFNL
ncbi:serine/threonine-protein kinase [Vigna angularis]|uniref:Serine/threonine-protein kinase n=1 Tax=Phaseolus angularis TaxID=3914 RepID=A0A8T0L993_PHAAN|nr:serine/threonine-protein kinase [Vigna angularis]